MPTVATAIDSDADAVALVASVTTTPKLDVPVMPTGTVPLITPLLLRVSPGGSAPLPIDHEYGAVPPLAASVAEYDTPTVVACNAVVVTARPPQAVRNSALPAASASPTTKRRIPIVHPFSVTRARGRERTPRPAALHGDLRTRASVPGRSSAPTPRRLRRGRARTW